MTESTLNDDGTGSTQKTRWRRRYLIDTHAQGRFLTTTLLYLVIYSFFLIIILVFPGIETLRIEGWSAVEANFSGDRGSFIIDRLLPALFLFMILVALHSLIMTNRIFGPLYRIEKRMIDMADGDLKSMLHFRKNDFLRGLDITINRAISAVGENIDEIIANHDHLDQQLDQFLGVLQSGSLSQQSISHTVKAIQQEHEKIFLRLKSLRAEHNKAGEASKPEPPD